MFINFVVSGDGRAFVEGWVIPPRMSASFTKQLTAMTAKMAKEFRTLHTGIGSSSKSLPAALNAS